PRRRRGHSAADLGARRGGADRPRRRHNGARAWHRASRGGRPDHGGTHARDPRRTRAWPAATAHSPAAPARRRRRGRRARPCSGTRVAHHALSHPRRRRTAPLRLHARPVGPRVGRRCERARADTHTGGGGVMPAELPAMHARTPDEIARVRCVYRGYAERGRGTREWASDHPGNRAMVDERTRVLAGLLERSGRLPLGSRRVLDLGCGDGEVIAGFVRWGALPERLVGVDVRTDAVARAHAHWPEIRFDVADATALPYRDASFDLALCFTLFTSILDDGIARQVASELRRVLRPGGALLWYDFRVGNPWNPTVRGRPRRSAQALFPGWPGTFRLVPLLPPLARRLRSLTPVLYPVLAALAPLRTHWAGLLERPR